MRILLDNSVNHRFADLITRFDVVHARSMGWAELENGTLLSVAESAGLAALITTDKNMRNQQNLTGKGISVLILNSRRITLESLKPLAPSVSEALEQLLPGSFVVVDEA